MNYYSVKDLSETLHRVRIERDEIEEVLYAWGDTFGPNSLVYDKPYDFLNGDTSWEGGFIILLKDKRVLYISGKCDYTGWGCVDEIKIKEIANIPSNYSLDEYKKAFEIDEKTKPDKAPVDLNRWIKRSLK